MKTGINKTSLTHVVLSTNWWQNLKSLVLFDNDLTYIVCFSQEIYQRFFFFCPESFFLSHMHFKHLSREIHILKSDPNNRLIPCKILISLENYIAPLISSLFCPFPNLRWAPSKDFWISLQKLNKLLINTASQLQNHDDSYAL